MRMRDNLAMRSISLLASVLVVSCATTDRTDSDCYARPVATHPCDHIRNDQRSHEILMAALDAAAKERPKIVSTGVCVGWSNNLDIDVDLLANLQKHSHAELLPFSVCALDPGDLRYHAPDNEPRAIVLFQCLRKGDSPGVRIDILVSEGPQDAQGLLVTIQEKDGMLREARRETTWTN